MDKGKALGVLLTDLLKTSNFNQMNQSSQNYMHTVFLR